MKKTNTYWTPHQILPYQRNFNFINGERSLGKTYNTEIFLLDKALNKTVEFVYICRTMIEKEEWVFRDAFDKVINNEFPEINFDFTKDLLTVDGVVIGHCIALSEAMKIKRKSYPKVMYTLMDEYMLEQWQNKSYVSGWKEPDLFLSIYHTIDREEDRVKCFLLGNNTTFFNPYHMHSAFNIPEGIERGQIWKSKNVLYQWAVSSDELKELKKNVGFLEMIDGSAYGDYAKNGNYSDGGNQFIMKRSAKADYVFSFVYNDNIFGVWRDFNAGIVFIDKKFDPSFKRVYALTLSDHTENTLLTKGKNISVLKWLSKMYKLGVVRFTDNRVKALSEGGIKLLL